MATTDDAAMIGRWGGTNGFRLMPNDELHEAAASATVSAAAGGSSLVVAYTWEHPADGAQDGLLLVGSPEAGQRDVTAAWSDSWHQQPGLLSMSGTRTRDRIDLSADYGGGWRWMISVEVSDDDRLLLTMHNVVPEEFGTTESPAGAYPVMIAALRRVAEPVS